MDCIVTLARNFGKTLHQEILSFSTWMYALCFQSGVSMVVTISRFGHAGAFGMGIILHLLGITLRDTISESQFLVASRTAWRIKLLDSVGTAYMRMRFREKS